MKVAVSTGDSLVCCLSVLLHGSTQVDFLAALKAALVALMQEGMLYQSNSHMHRFQSVNSFQMEQMT